EQDGIRRKAEAGREEACAVDHDGLGPPKGGSGDKPFGGARLHGTTDCRDMRHIGSARLFPSAA
ncbi:MAG: hypothetical protein ABN488_15785, partial [Methylobacteriaceae bacterium]